MKFFECVTKVIAANGEDLTQICFADYLELFCGMTWGYFDNNYSNTSVFEEDYFYYMEHPEECKEGVLQALLVEEA